MIDRYLNLFAALIVLLTMSGCASRIGNPGSIEHHVFEIGKTSKNEVVDALGLPAKMRKDATTGTEQLAYQQEPTVVSVMLPKVDHLGQITTRQYYGTDIYKDEFTTAAVVYTFDHNGVLIDAQRNQQTQK